MSPVHRGVLAATRILQKLLRIGFRACSFEFLLVKICVNGMAFRISLSLHYFKFSTSANMMVRTSELGGMIASFIVELMLGKYTAVMRKTK